MSSFRNPVVPEKEKDDLSVVKETRITTNYMFMGLFALSIIYNFIIFVYGIVEGKNNLSAYAYHLRIYSLTHSYDFNGTFCDTNEKPYIYYPHMQSDVMAV